MTIRFMREANYCCLLMGFGVCQIPMGFWSAAPLDVKISHKPVEVAYIGTVFAGSNVTVHRKSLNPLVLGFFYWDESERMYPRCSH